LTEFFTNDSSSYMRQLLAVTYTFENDTEVVVYFSVSNDRISREQAKTKGKIRKLQKDIPGEKHRDAYPAVKVGRLAVHESYERQGIGSDVLDFIKNFFTLKNKTGCRFITVDAINELLTIKFYEKNGFSPLTEEDKDERTRLMFYDLFNHIPSPTDDPPPPLDKSGSSI